MLFLHATWPWENPRDASVDVAPLRAPDQMEGHGVSQAQAA